MDRRTLLAIVLSLGIYSAWLLFRGPPKKPAAPPPEDVAEAPAPPVEPAPAPSGEATAGPVEVVPLEACGTMLSVSTEGGAIHGVVLPDVPGPYDVTPIYSWVLGFFTGSSSVPWRPYGPEPGPAALLTDRARGIEVEVGGVVPHLPVVERAPGRVVLEGRTADGLVVRHSVSEHPGEVCTLDVATTFSNPGAAPASPTVSWALRDHTSAPGRRGTSQHQPTAFVDGSLFYGGALGAGCVRAGTQLKDGSAPIELAGPVSWFGASDRYFGFFVLPAADQGALRFERVGSGADALDGGVLSKALQIPAGGQVDWTGRVYAGENHVATLRAVDPTLERVVDLGWFAMFGKPLLWILSLLHGWLGDWGFAIIGVTVLLKVLFFPLTWRAMKGGQAMQAIQPELAKLREQFADDPQEMNRRTLELMSQHGANPLSGCWPMLVQTPVFIALYNVLLTNVEFYQEPFAYLRDLSSPDPYCLLPLAVTGLMFGQQRLTPTPENMDPAQQAVLKWMPVLFGLFFFTSPSGLAIYVFVNVSLSIVQQWMIKRSLGTGPVKAPAPVGR